MSSNRGVAYVKPGTVEVRSIDYPKLRMPKSESDPFGGKDAPHGVILRVVTTNICGSDQHMVRGRTTAPAGLIFWDEITGEIIEEGGDGEMAEGGAAGPVGLACAASAHLLGAAVVIVGDMIPERLAQAKSFGCEVVDLRKEATLAQQIEQILGEPVVDAAVDCVGFEAHGHGKDAGAE